MNKRPAEQQFSLIEIILAVAIFSVIAALFGAVLFSVQKSYLSLQEDTDRLETRLKLDRIADTAFRNAVPFHWPDEDGRNTQVFQGQQSRIRLAYLHRIRGPLESGLRFLELELRDSQLIARYRQQPLIEATTSEVTEEVIASDIRSIRFSYARKLNREIAWSSEFDAVEAETIPAAILITIEFEDDSVLKYLRRTAGSSHLSTYGKDETVNL